MTPHEAKALTLEVWTYLRDNPKIDSKSNLPECLLDKIKRLKKYCPLCELYYDNDGVDCTECPLKSCGEGSYWNKWAWAWKSTRKTRKEAATKIVKLVSAWEPVEVENAQRV
jgi:hypothetical protein